MFILILLLPFTVYAMSGGSTTKKPDLCQPPMEYALEHKCSLQQCGNIGSYTCNDGKHWHELKTDCKGNVLSVEKKSIKNILIIGSIIAIIFWIGYELLAKGLTNWFCKGE